MHLSSKFILVTGDAEYALNFRGPLIAALHGRGFEVHVVAPPLPDDHAVAQRLKVMGVRMHSVLLARTGTNPLADLSTLWNLWRVMRRVRPDYSLGYTVKPVVYGSLAARLAGVKHRFALITGLGYAFQEGRGGRGLRRLVQQLYALALRQVHKVFFQNPDDESLFRERGIISSSKATVIVNGSGVDLERFALAPLHSAGVRFLLVGRLLGAKGVREYVEAARRVRARHADVRCALVGWIDENPDAILHDELNAWVAEGVVDYLGRMADVRPAIRDCSVFVLPSYREGTPRSVLEAMSMGRPVITTDAPGCRETVVDGVNGFLVPTHSAEALTEAMQRFVDSPALIVSMGAEARRIAEEKYDVHKVNAVMLHEMAIK